MSKIKKSIHPDDDAHYEKMGLKRNEVEIWEDGARVDGSKVHHSSFIIPRSARSPLDTRGGGVI